MYRRGVEQLVARRAHNPKVAGSNPVPATMMIFEGPTTGRTLFYFYAQAVIFFAHPTSPFFLHAIIILVRMKGGGI